MWKWVQKLFKKKEEPEPEVVYACPKCGSTRLGYYTGLINFIMVINDMEEARYGQSAICLSCGYRTDVYEEGGKLDISNELKVIKCTTSL